MIKLCEVYIQMLFVPPPTHTQMFGVTEPDLIKSNPIKQILINILLQAGKRIAGPLIALLAKSCNLESIAEITGVTGK